MFNVKDERIHSMKNFKTLFGMMFVALIAASCTNDVNDVLAPESPQKGYHFVATIAPKTFDATTRTLLVEDTENGTISSTWQEKDEILISYWADGETFPISVTAKVSKVASDGSATIEATLEKLPTSTGDHNANLSYPAIQKIDEQDGQLSGDRDLRYGYATLVVVDDKVTFKNEASLFADCSILSFSMSDLKGGDINADKLVISCKDYFDVDDDLTITVTPPAGETLDKVYVSIPSWEDMGARTFWFEATASDGTPYIAKATGTLELGMYYQTTLKMATVGNVIGSDGKFYKDADAAGTAAEAMIAYLGNEATDAPHGLAIALEKASANYVTWDASGDNNGKKTAEEIVDAWANNHAVTGGTWRLPSAYDWQRMFIGCGSTHEYVSSLNNMEFGYGNFFTLWKSATSSSFPSYYYWTSTTSGSECAWVVIFESSTAFFDGQQYKDSIYQVRACLAF